MTDVELVLLGFIAGFFVKPYIDILITIIDKARKNTKDLED